MRKTRVLSSLAVAAALAGCATPRPWIIETDYESPSRGTTTNFEPIAIDIPAGRASDAIYIWGRQTGANYLYDCKDVEGVNTPALQTLVQHPEDALRSLFEGTDLTFIEVNIGSYVIVRAR
jgi:hypothetical protein